MPEDDQDIQQETPAAKRRRWPLYVVLGTLAAIPIIVMITRTISGSSSSSTAEHNVVQACQDEVLAKLKAPSSADFSNAGAVHAAGQTADFYTVTGAVDSQNGFGAMIRNSFTCKITVERDGHWRLDDLHFSGR